MKKVGILFGQEKTFPQAFVDRVNHKNVDGIQAEFVKIDKVVQGVCDKYSVIIDRISQDVPFYRAFLKNAASAGAAVINNPFWWSADDKFFNNALALGVGVKVPKTVLLPSNSHPADTTADSMRNLDYPLNWEAIFDYIGFPAFFKPFAGGGWKHVYRVTDRDDFFAKYNQTGQLVMMLQEEVVFEEYYRCYGIGYQDVKLMEYDPRKPFHEQYSRTPKPIPAARQKQLRNAVLKLCIGLGYEFNTVELAMRDNEPYAIDFGNPAPDADVNSVGPENFEWIVEAASNLAIRRAQAHQEGKMNLSWGKFVSNAVKGSRVTTRSIKL